MLEPSLRRAGEHSATRFTAFTTVSAVSNSGWITIIAGRTGGGSGTVTYFVAANTRNRSRSGSITVAGLRFRIDQARR